MTVLNIVTLSGERPRINPRLLKIGESVLAQNCNFAHGVLDQWKRPALEETLGTTTVKKSFYRLENPADPTLDTWFAATADTDLQFSPIPNDTTRRFYYTDGTQCKVSNYALYAAGPTVFNLGSPIPTAALTVTPTLGTAGLEVTRFYVYTRVLYMTNADRTARLGGMESLPIAAASATGPSDGTWTLSGFETTAPTTYGITQQSVRIYRTATGNTGADFFLVTEVDSTAAPYTYVDNVADTTVVGNATLPSALWTAPPATLAGLVAMPGGFMAGFKDNSVYFSEPYYPHAWPDSYKVNFDAEVVGLGVFGSTLVVMTTGATYAVSGTHPAVVTSSRFPQAEPCRSKRSIVSFVTGVAYASANGLVVVDSSGLNVVSSQHFTREEWAELSPATMFSARYGSRYVGYYDSFNAIVFDPMEANSFVTRIATEETTALFTNADTGLMYRCHTNEIEGFDAAVDTYPTSSVWYSGVMVTPKPINLGAVRIEGDYSNIDESVDNSATIAANAALLGSGLGGYAFAGLTRLSPAYRTFGSASGALFAGSALTPLLDAVQYSATFYLYSGDYHNEVLRATISPTSNEIRKLPAGYKAEHWHIKIQSTIPIFRIQVAETARELRSV